MVYDPYFTSYLLHQRREPFAFFDVGMKKDRSIIRLGQRGGGGGCPVLVLGNDCAGHRRILSKVISGRLLELASWIAWHSGVFRFEESGGNLLQSVYGKFPGPLPAPK
jgi:hypothetical protein